MGRLFGTDGARGVANSGFSGVFKGWTPVLLRICSLQL